MIRLKQMMEREWPRILVLTLTDFIINGKPEVVVKLVGKSG